MSGKPTVDELLEAARTANTGWSSTWGGPAGVERLAVTLQQDLLMQAEALAGLRSLALTQMLRDRSVADVARELGTSRQAVAKAAARARDAAPIAW